MERYLRKIGAYWFRENNRPFPIYFEEGKKRIGKIFVRITERAGNSAHPYESLDILPSTPIESPYKRLGGSRAQPPLIRPNLKYTFHFSTGRTVPL